MLKVLLGNWFVPGIVFIVALFAVYLFAPLWAGVAAGIIIFIILAMAIFSVVQNQRKLYREKRISRNDLVRNVFYEGMGILLAMIMAFVIGKYITEIATGQIGNDLIRFAAAIVIGLLTGMGVGFVVKRTWGHLVKA